MAELVGLRDAQTELAKRGGRLMAVCVDTPEESRGVVQKRTLNYAILADTDRRAIGLYGLVHKGAGPGGRDIAIPAHVLIDRDGRIVWRHVAHRVQDRPDPAADLAAIRALGGA